MKKKETYKTNHPKLKTITEGEKYVGYNGNIYEFQFKLHDYDQEDGLCFVFALLYLEDGEYIFGSHVGFPLDLYYKDNVYGIKCKYISLKDKIDLL